MNIKDKQPLREQLDNLAPKQHLIEKHALSNVDAHTKELYMTLLAAIAFEDRKLAQSENYYLQALCNSVKDVDYESIKRRIDKIGDTLEESLKAIEENKLAVWLFIDALIICRLDSEITEKESKLLGSLADSLKLAPKEVSLCLKFATIILSQDEVLLRDMVSEVPTDFPFYALQAAYISPWFDVAKYSFAEDLAAGHELKGKYYIYESISIPGDCELNGLDLVFAEGAKIAIVKKAKLKITGSKLSQAEIICSDSSSLTLNKCSFSGGKGIYSGIDSSLSVSQCYFNNAGIGSDKASKIVLDNVSFENLIDRRAMSLTNCMNVTLQNSKFISCGYDPKNTIKAEGGALLIGDCAILIDACSFENCTASGDGGAISFWDSVYGIKGSKFIQCKSGMNGGAMVVHETFSLESYEQDMQSLISLVHESDHIDSNRGKGIPLSKEVKFMGCTAENFGGAVMSHTRDLRFFDCLFEKCSAPYRGGGVTVMGTDVSRHYTRFFACLFVENKSKEGDGLWMERFRLGYGHRFRIDITSDIRQSNFHKCKTNHDPLKNSDGGNLNDQNTFTE